VPLSITFPRKELSNACSTSALVHELEQLGGSVSGEHGLGLLKRGHSEWSKPVAALQRQIKEGCDPKGLLNPGKKLPADDPVSG
jgi:FAD/FMN-containing dehydrogenase